MEDLVILESGQLDFNPVVYTVTPFRKIRRKDWFEDKMDKQEGFEALIGYIFYMSDYRSSYLKNYDIEEAERRIKNAHSIPQSWKPPAEVEEAIQWWKDYQYTITLDLINKTYATMRHNSAVVDFLNRSIKAELDKENVINAETGKKQEVDSGVLIGMLKDVYNLGKELPKLKETLDQLYKQLTIELSQNTKARKGNKVINPLEKASNIEDIVSGDNAGVSEKTLDDVS